MIPCINHKPSRRSLVLGAATAFALTTAAPAATAKDYPSRAINVVVPYAPGGTADVLFRLIAPGMEKSLGQNIVVVNRAGASGMIGTESVARAAPDGYTLLVVTAGLPIAASVNRSNPNFTFNIQKDIEPVAAYASTPYFLFTSKSLGVKNVAEFIAMARERPGKITYGSSGAGQSGHLAGAKFELNTGTQMLHVPYKGTGPAMNDLAAGHIDSIFVGLPTAVPFLDANRIEVLGVASPERVSLRPDIATLDESGTQGFEARAWYGVFAPAGTPAAIKDKVSKAVLAAMSDPGLTDKLTGLGAIPMVMDTAKLSEFFTAEIRSVNEVVDKLPSLK